MIERKLRVMMLAPTPFFSDCGCHVRIYEEARALARRGHGVRIVTYHLGRDMPGVQAMRIGRVPWLKSLPAGPAWHGPYLDILLFQRALRLAREFRPHLIHGHLHGGAWVGARLKKRLKIPLLFDYQGSLTDEMTETGLVREGSMLQRFLVRRERGIDLGASDYVITRSAPMADDLVDRWGLARGRVEPLPDGVDTSLFRPHPRDEVRARLRIPPAVPLVVCLGLLKRTQGIDTLLSAIVQLQSKGSPLRFLIVGYPEEQYRARAFELGIDRMLTFAGKVDYTRIPYYLSAGDLAVSPLCSPLESNGKLLNYLACGLPTVAFDTPVNRELLGEAGVYANYDDAADLASRLTWLADNRDERERLGRLGRELAEQRHGWSSRGMALDEIYRVKLKV